MSFGVWNHNIHYHQLVLASIPQDCRCALDVGCGQGMLTRRLAERCQQVIAIDSDRDVISTASAGDGLEQNIKFVVGDVMTYPFPDDSFDLIVAVAALHHLRLRPALTRFRGLLRAGGVLAIVGLYRAETLSDYALCAAAFPVSWALRLFRGYAEVGASVQDPQETLSEIRSAWDVLLPGASLRRQLLFRYFLSWRKP
ncbi:MAG TPA: class I SAM-dependent methyltransferase [Candidatus Angelobacter sp.]|nr:class I SAM-dependent methyltransferase [Candidatus Angelobacter sp.]